MQYKRLRPSQVRLDPQNPRLPAGTNSDREAVNRLLAEGFPALLELGKDLVNTGESNPAELPIVVKDGGKYLVLEGNRRFAALKLLRNPSLADEAAHRTAFVRLTKKGTPPKTVMCAVDTSRDNADHWLVLRHTGQNKGVGVRPWSAEQVANHRRRANAQVESGTSRSLTIADELEEAYALDADLVATIRRVRSRKVTNIGRLFAGEVLDRLHLSIQDTDDLHARPQTLWAKHDSDELHEFFKWAMDYIDANPVDAYKNPSVRSALLDKHRKLLPDTTNIADAGEARLADTPWTPPGTNAETDGHDSDGAPGGGGSVTEQSGSNDEQPERSETEGAFKGTEMSDPASSPDSASGYVAGSRRKQEAKLEKRLFQDLKLPYLS